MKTNYERPESEERDLVLENSFLSGNMENPNDQGEGGEIDIDNP